jgi:hypothetical protein
VGAHKLTVACTIGAAVLLRLHLHQVYIPRMSLRILVKKATYLASGNIYFALLLTITSYLAHIEMYF